MPSLSMYLLRTLLAFAEHRRGSRFGGSRLALDGAKQLCGSCDSEPGRRPRSVPEAGTEPAGRADYKTWATGHEDRHAPCSRGSSERDGGCRSNRVTRVPRFSLQSGHLQLEWVAGLGVCTRATLA